MKATGIVRKVDDLGRIVLPKELCRIHGIESGTPPEIYTDGQDIILRRYQPGCVFCGELDTVGMIGGKLICKSCAKKSLEVLRESNHD